MEICVNEQARTIAEGSTLVELLQSLGVDPRHVAVMHNGRILTQTEQHDARLAHKDRLEILRMMGGG